MVPRENSGTTKKPAHWGYVFKGKMVLKYKDRGSCIPHLMSDVGFPYALSNTTSKKTPILNAFHGCRVCVFEHVYQDTRSRASI